MADISSRFKLFYGSLGADGDAESLFDAQLKVIEEKKTTTSLSAYQQRLKALRDTGFTVSDLEVFPAANGSFEYRCVLVQGQKRFPQSKECSLLSDRIVKIQRSGVAKEFVKKQEETREKNEANPFYGLEQRNSVARLLVDAFVSSLSRGPKAGKFCFRFTLGLRMAILSPFLLLSLLAVPLLVLLTPLALLLALIHHMSHWAFVAISAVVCAGAIADNVADITMLIKMLYYYFSNDPGEPVTEAQGIFLLVRLLLTLLGPLVICVFVIFLVATLKELKGEKNDSSSSSFRGNMVGVVVLAVLIKVAFIGLRGFALFYLIYSRRGSLTPQKEMILGAFEFIFALDFLWSGLWLGVVTVVEIIILGTRTLELPFAFEIWKLSALAIDSIGVAYFVVIVLWFDKRICGLEQKEHKPKQLEETTRLIQ